MMNPIRAMIPALRQIMHSRKTALAAAVCQICGLAMAAPAGSSTLQPPKLLGDPMVLQQEKPIRIRGVDAPGTEVVVTLNGQSQQPTSGCTGTQGTVENDPTILHPGPTLFPEH